MSTMINGTRGHRRARRQQIADINVTPLVDVMLVLLVIFMVTAPMLTAGVPVDLPNSQAKQLERESEPVEISIDRNGRIFLGDKFVPAAAIEKALAPLARKGSHGQSPQVMLHADKSLDYGKVASLMGQLNQIGMNRIALITEGPNRS